MNREEYIDSAVVLIEDYVTREEVRKELNAHFDERVEYYTNAGYSEAYALGKTLGQMGNAEDLKLQFSQLHSEKNRQSRAVINIVCSVIITLISVICTLLLNGIGFPVVVIELLFLCLVFVLTTEAMKYKMLSLNVTALASFGVWSLFKLLHVSFSNLVVSAYFILTGKAVMLGYLDTFAGYVSFALWLHIVSAIIYTIIFAFLIAALIVNAKARKRCCPLKIIHLKNGFQAAAKYLVVFLLAFLALTAFFTYSNIAEPEFSKTETYIIIEGNSPDEPVQQGKFKYPEGTVFMLDDMIPPEGCTVYENEKDVFTDYVNLRKFPYDENAAVWWEDYDMKTVELNDIMSYDQINNYAECRVSSEYYCVYAINMGGDIVYSSGWQSSAQEREYTFNVESGKYPISVHHITVKHTDGKSYVR